VAHSQRSRRRNAHPSAPWRAPCPEGQGGGPFRLERRGEWRRRRRGVPVRRRAGSAPPGDRPAGGGPDGRRHPAGAGRPEESGGPQRREKGRSRSVLRTECAAVHREVRRWKRTRSAGCASRRDAWRAGRSQGRQARGMLAPGRGGSGRTRRSGAPGARPPGGASPAGVAGAAGPANGPGARASSAAAAAGGAPQAGGIRPRPGCPGEGSPGAHGRPPPRRTWNDCGHCHDADGADGDGADSKAAPIRRWRRSGLDRAAPRPRWPDRHTVPRTAGGPAGLKGRETGRHAARHRGDPRRRDHVPPGAGCRQVSPPGRHDRR
jgi:hypothetical protein